MTIGFTGLKYPIQLNERGGLALSTTSMAGVTQINKAYPQRMTQKPTTYISGPDVDAATKLAVVDGVTIGNAGTNLYMVSSNYTPTHSNITINSVQLQGYMKGNAVNEVILAFKNLPIAPGNTYTDVVTAPHTEFNWVDGTKWFKDPEGNSWTESSALNCHFGLQGGAGATGVHVDGLFKIINYSYSTVTFSGIKPTMAHIEESVLQILKTVT
ncbi:MAG: hypothetical protein WCJ57_04895, partial [Candidatus Falkowbacteria bacterium]